MSAPLYQRTAELLRSRIVGREWPPGTRLPSEQELCVEFGVSSITMRRSIASLVAEGLVVRQQGRGTFVAADPVIVQGSPRLTSFTQDLAQRGWSASSRVLEVTTSAGTDLTCSRLGVPPGARVTVVRRLRLADGIPIAVQSAHLPALSFPDIEGRLADGTASLYEVLRHDYGTAPGSATETLRVDAATPADAGLLEVPAGSPVFRIERLTNDSFDRRIEYCESVVRGDRYSVVQRLHAAPAGDR